MQERHDNLKREKDFWKVFKRFDEMFFHRPKLLLSKPFRRNFK
jgi:hypothetical protein